jgi:hypothetical protein
MKEALKWVLKRTKKNRIKIKIYRIDYFNFIKKQFKKILYII